MASTEQSARPRPARRLAAFVLRIDRTRHQGLPYVGTALYPDLAGKESWKRSARLGCDCHPGAGARESEKEREGERPGREGGVGGEKEEGGEEGRGGEAGAREGRGERQRAGEGAGEEEGEGEARLTAGLAAAAQRFLPVLPPTTPREGGASGAHKASESSISNLASWQDLCEAKSRAPQCKERGGKRESCKGGGRNPAGASKARRGEGSAVAAGGAREASEEAPRAGAREPGPEKRQPGAAGGQVPARSPSQGAARLVGGRGAARPMPVCGHVLPAGLLVPAVRLSGALLVPGIQHQRHLGAPHG